MERRVNCRKVMMMAVRVGIIGMGFMGRMHLAAYSQLPEAEVGGVCGH